MPGLSAEDQRHIGLKYALLTVMESLSRDRYCWLWHDGLEHILWDAMTSGDSVPIPRSALWALQALHDATGGWWISDQGVLHFVTTEEWQAVRSRPGVQP